MGERPSQYTTAGIERQRKRETERGGSDRIGEEEIDGDVNKSLKRSGGG